MQAADELRSLSFNLATVRKENISAFLLLNWEGKSYKFKTILSRTCKIDWTEEFHTTEKLLGEFEIPVDYPSEYLVLASLLHTRFFKQLPHFMFPANVTRNELATQS